jgi:hypothetical protein
MPSDLQTIYDRLYAYCEAKNFAGPDPFDGLNSRIFQATPLKNSRNARLAWLQAVKRSPVDLRRILSIKKGVNPKSLALFALAELSRFRKSGSEQHAENAKMLIDRLMEARIDGATAGGQPTLAFGYNFDWQSRVFYAPCGTPAIVPTAFAHSALVEAFEVFGDEKYLDGAAAIAKFIMHDLNRPVETDDEVCFSYTPLDETIVYNASLLAGECLARVGSITGNDEHLKLAANAARFVVRRQRDDGAWVYGGDEKQGWADNFHTAYILVSLHRIMSAMPELETEMSGSLERGLGYWIENFFLNDGTPKYYDNETYPIDIHSAAAAIAGLIELRSVYDRAMAMSRKVAEWTTANMLDTRGLFYYQKRKSGIVKTPHMRWGQAWIAYALAHLIEAESDGK